MENIMARKEPPVTITEILTRRCPRSKKSPCGNIHKYISKP
jgi:hypothetical protein